MIRSKYPGLVSVLYQRQPALSGSSNSYQVLAQMGCEQDQIAGNITNAVRASRKCSENGGTALSRQHFSITAHVLVD